MLRISSVSVLLLCFVITCGRSQDNTDSDCPEFNRGLCAIEPSSENKDKYECQSDYNCAAGRKCCNHCSFAYKICTEVVLKEYIEDGDDYLKNKYCPKVKPCYTPLLYNIKYRCGSDVVCPYGYKCCRTDCYIHKVCVVPIDKEGNEVAPPITTSTIGETISTTLLLLLPTLKPDTSSSETQQPITAVFSTVKPETSTKFEETAPPTRYVDPFTDDDDGGDDGEDNGSGDDGEVQTQKPIATSSLTPTTTAGKEETSTKFEETTPSISHVKPFTDDDSGEGETQHPITAAFSTVKQETSTKFEETTSSISHVKPFTDDDSGEVETQKPNVTSTLTPIGTTKKEETSIKFEETTSPGPFTDDDDGGDDGEENGSGPATTSSAVPITTLKEEETSTNFHVTTARSTEFSTADDKVITQTLATKNPPAAFSTIKQETVAKHEETTTGTSHAPPSTDDEDSEDDLDDNGSGDDDNEKPFTTSPSFSTEMEENQTDFSIAESEVTYNNRDNDRNETLQHTTKSSFRTTTEVQPTSKENGAVETLKPKTTTETEVMSTKSQLSTRFEDENVTLELISTTLLLNTTIKPQTTKRETGKTEPLKPKPTTQAGETFTTSNLYTEISSSGDESTDDEEDTDENENLQSSTALPLRTTTKPRVIIQNLTELTDSGSGESSVTQQTDTTTSTLLEITTDLIFLEDNKTTTTLEETTKFPVSIINSTESTIPSGSLDNTTIFNGTSQLTKTTVKFPTEDITEGSGDADDEDSLSTIDDESSESPTVTKQIQTSSSSKSHPTPLTYTTPDFDFKEEENYTSSLKTIAPTINTQHNTESSTSKFTDTEDFASESETVITQQLRTSTTSKLESSETSTDFDYGDEIDNDTTSVTATQKSLSGSENLTTTTKPQEVTPLNSSVSDEVEEEEGSGGFSDDEDFSSPETNTTELSVSSTSFDGSGSVTDRITDNDFTYEENVSTLSSRIEPAGLDNIPDLVEGISNFANGSDGKGVQQIISNSTVVDVETMTTGKAQEKPNGFSITIQPVDSLEESSGDGNGSLMGNDTTLHGDVVEESTERVTDASVSAKTNDTVRTTSSFTETKEQDKPEISSVVVQEPIQTLDGILESTRESSGDGNGSLMGNGTTLHGDVMEESTEKVTDSSVSAKTNDTVAPTPSFIETKEQDKPEISSIVVKALQAPIQTLDDVFETIRESSGDGNGSLIGNGDGENDDEDDDGDDGDEVDEDIRTNFQNLTHSKR